MADAQATFAITFDTSGLQAGAKAGDSALERLGARLQRLAKDLTANKAAQQRLMASASVKQYIAQQKAIEKTQSKASALEKKLAAAQENMAVAGQANVAPDVMEKLAADVDRYTSSLQEARSELERLDKAQASLGDDDAVKAYKDKSAVIAKQEGELADLQTQYDRAGGSAEGFGQSQDAANGQSQGLLGTLKSIPGPIGQFASKLEKVIDVAKKYGPAAAVVVILVAIAVAAVKGAIALTKFAMAAADMGANMRRARTAAAFGSTAGTKEIESTMKALRQETALSKQEAQDLAIELYRAGERGQALDEAAVTIARFGQLGDDAKEAVKGLYEQLRKPTPAIGGGQAKSMQVGPDTLPRDVLIELAHQLGKDANKAVTQGFTADKGQIRAALAKIGEQRFAGPAADQMRTLEKLSERLHENLKGLFENLYIGRILGGLQKLVDLLDDTTESGKGLRVAFGALAEPLIEAFEAALPYIVAFFKGVIFGGLGVVLIALKIKNALSGLIPSGLVKNIDGMELAFKIGGIAVLGFAVALGVLATALFLVMLPFFMIVGVLAAVVVGAIAAYDAIVGAFDAISAYLSSFSLADAVTGIIDGLIAAITENASKVYQTFAGLAKGGLDAFKSALGIKSPSLAFRMAGREIPRGVAAGVEDEAPAAEEATASITSPAALGGAGAGGGGSGAKVINLHVHPNAINISGVQGAEELKEEWFERLLARALTRAGLEGGVAPEPEGAT